MKAELSQSLSRWHLYTDNDTIQLSLISNTPPEPSVVQMTLTIHKTLQWDVCVHRKLLSPSYAIICKHPNFIQSGQDVQSVCMDLREAIPCEGNGDQEFIDLLVSRGGVVTNHGSTTAYLDQTNNTVRHSDCDLLCDGKSKCGICQKYRSTLRAMRYRKESSQSSKLSSSSHTNYRYLQRGELKDRLKSVQRSKRIAKRQNDRLREKLNKVIGSEDIELVDDDEDEIEQFFFSNRE